MELEGKRGYFQSAAQPGRLTCTKPLITSAAWPTRTVLPLLFWSVMALHCVCIPNEELPCRNRPVNTSARNLSAQVIWSDAIRGTDRTRKRLDALALLNCWRLSMLCLFHGLAQFWHLQ